VAFIDLSRGEIQVKIVYYGPGRCGKTTNLLFIHESMSKQVCGKWSPSTPVETEPSF